MKKRAETPESINRRRLLLSCAQLILSAVSSAMVGWLAVRYYKVLTDRGADLKLYSWTYPFFHPITSDGLNYLVVCCMFGVFALLAYFLKSRRVEFFLLRRCDSVNPHVLEISVGLSLLLLFQSLIWPGSILALYGFGVVASIPFVILSFSVMYDYSTGNAPPSKKSLLLIFAFALFLLVGKEPF